MRVRGIDAGGSGTRIAKSETDIYRSPSVCMEIPLGAPSKEHIIDNKLLDFVIKKCPREDLVDRRFVKQDAMNQYNGDVLVCDNQDAKVLQDITYVNILYAIAADCVRRSINDEEFKIGVCIPAAEYYDDKNDRIGEIKNNLVGATAIYFPMLDRTIRFQINRNNIGVVAEGVIAAFRFKRDRSFVMKNTVVVDVGYRSTDITVLLSFKPVGASAASRPIGGINLEANIQSQLERDNIFVTTSAVQTALSTTYVVSDDGQELVDITPYIEQVSMADDAVARVIDLMAADGLTYGRAQVEKAMRSHYLVQGQDIVDITSYVHNAKDVFVDAVYRAIVDVVNAKMMNINDMSNILCIGRPFSGDKNDPKNLINMLSAKFKDGINMYTVPDAGTANVVEIIKLLGEEQDDL